MQTNHPRRPRIPAGPRLTLIGLSLAGVAFMGLGSACSVQDAMCSGGEYPVASVGPPAGGGACVSDKEEPPKGFVRYPKGKVPRHVDDTWDKYWQEHSLDVDGNEVK
ncbi:SCO0607 family lipoprotein [Streptomyces sp. NPDC008139]|uniref:SCO0607 family lipoprotein n=1 Tax=Streptomyces sp. NPDC008139 TaxID=3364814 RepID=UPI0036E632AB